MLGWSRASIQKEPVPAAFLSLAVSYRRDHDEARRDLGKLLGSEPPVGKPHDLKDLSKEDRQRICDAAISLMVHWSWRAVLVAV